jgi:hypothetical protein
VPALFLLAALAVASAGCGGGSDRSTGSVPAKPQARHPALSTARPVTQPAPAPPPKTHTTPAEPPPAQPGNGGTQAPPPEPTQAPAAQDGQGNDTPPPAGSPAARFEHICEQSPDACN